MRKILFALILFLLVSTGTVYAQDTLPKISIKALGTKVLVSWKNEYLNIVSVIDIQRSYDSLRNFATIGTILNPTNEDNGFVDTKPPKVKAYYRVFIAFEGGAYAFSKSYRKPEYSAKPPVSAPPPVIKILEPVVPIKMPAIIAAPVKPIIIPKKVVPVKASTVKKDSVVIISPTVVVPKSPAVPVTVVVVKDELLHVNPLPKDIIPIKENTVFIKQIKLAKETAPVLIRQRVEIDIYPDSRDTRRQHINIRRDSADIIAKLPFKPSKYINIGKDNDVIINLPLFATKKYSIKFYAEKDTAVLFEISKITEPYLILEKVNFKHSGWFRYHLYSNGVLVEKYGIYIAIDDKAIPMVKEKKDLGRDK